MKRISISLSSTRAKIITALLISLTILTISVATAYYQTPNAYSQASATGSFSMIWGDPYHTPTISQGTGSESLTITGNVAKQPNLPGYYAYTTLTLSGSLHAEWSDNGNNYVLNASLYLSAYETGYERISINPSGDSFYVSFMDYTASLTVNGVTNHTSGEAGIKAAAPGFFAFQGQARTTTIIIYAPSLGHPQYVIRWSETSQTIDGIPQPAASQFTQVVRMNGSS